MLHRLFLTLVLFVLIGLPSIAPLKAFKRNEMDGNVGPSRPPLRLVTPQFILESAQMTPEENGRVFTVMNQFSDQPREKRLASFQKLIAYLQLRNTPEGKLQALNTFYYWATSPNLPHEEFKNIFYLPNIGTGAFLDAIDMFDEFCRTNGTCLQHLSPFCQTSRK